MTFPPPVAQRLRAVRMLQPFLPLAAARDVEGAVFYAAYTRQCTYGDKMLQLACNFKLRGPDLLHTYTVHALPFLSDAVLAEGTPVEAWWEAHNARLETQQNMVFEEAKFEEGEQLNVGLLICNRCHSRSISVQQQQIRSADEGMTVFCTCNKCNLRWKM